MELERSHGGQTEKEALRAFVVVRGGGQREEPAEVEGVFHTVLSPAAKVSGDATGTGRREDRARELC